MTEQTIEDIAPVFTESEDLLFEVCSLANVSRLDPASEDGQWLMALCLECEEIPAGKWDASDEVAERLTSLASKMAAELGLTEEVAA